LLDLKNGGDPQLILSPDSSLGTYQGPVLSQDGTRIALYVYKKYTLTTDATPYSSSRILADCTEPSWSWDGSQILCRALDGFLEIVDAQTGQLIEQFSLYGVIPAWSPGGGEAVYASSGNDSSTVICRFDFDSQTTVVLAGDKFENYAPSWSPDGEWIAYQSAETGGMSQIWIMDRDGRDGRQITDAGNWSRGPAWSPDGQWLAFVSEANGSIGADYGEVFVVSLNSGESYQVTHTGGNVYDWRVSWSK
jgi:TolB protein